MNTIKLFYESSRKKAEFKQDYSTMSRLGLWAFYDENKAHECKVELENFLKKINSSDPTIAINTIEIDEEKIISYYDLNFEIDSKIIRAVYESFNFDPRDFDIINECVLKENFLQNMTQATRIFKTELLPVLINKVLEIRVCIARTAGFDAIEMPNGQYLVVNGKIS